VLHGEAAAVGRTLYAVAAEGGAKAQRLRAGRIAAGLRADLVAHSLDHPLLAGSENDASLDTLVFALPRLPFSDVFVAGSLVVSNGTHPLEEENARALRHPLGVLGA
jgi:formimidoylglutamate deiminase